MHRDVPAVAGEAEGDLASDALGGAGHERGFTGEIHRWRAYRSGRDAARETG